MRRTLLVLVLFPLRLAVLLSLFPAAGQCQELMVPVAMSGGSPSGVWAAYSDNTVWRMEGQLIEIPGANRGIPIRMMCRDLYSTYILYDDNQVWYGGVGPGMQHYATLIRSDDPDLKPVAFAVGPNTGLVAAYADGQIWTTGGRVEMWERHNPASGVGEPEGESTSRVLPNPTPGACRVSFTVPRVGRVSVQLLDASGRMVRQLLNGALPVGDYSPTWDGKDDAGNALPSGVYLTRIETAGGVTTGKVTLAK